MDNADGRGHHAKGFEGLLPPFEKLVTLFIPAEFDLQIFQEGVGRARAVNLHGVIDDEVDWNERLDDGRVFAQCLNRVAHSGQVDKEWHTCKVL